MGGSSMYKNRWIAEKLDRINLTTPKGKKEAIDEYRKTHGYSSVNEFINAAIDAAIASGMSKSKQD